MAVLACHTIGKIAHLGAAGDAVLQRPPAHAGDALHAVAEIEPVYTIKQLLSRIDVVTAGDVVAIYAFKAERRVCSAREIIAAS